MLGALISQWAKRQLYACYVSLIELIYCCGGGLQQTKAGCLVVFRGSAEDMI